MADSARGETAEDAVVARLRLALKASGMGTFLWYPQEDRTEPDGRMLELFGLPADGSISLASALATLIHPDDQARYAEAVVRATDPMDPASCARRSAVHAGRHDPLAVGNRADGVRGGKARASGGSGRRRDRSQNRGGSAAVERPATGVRARTRRSARLGIGSAGAGDARLRVRGGVPEHRLARLRRRRRCRPGDLRGRAGELPTGRGTSALRALCVSRRVPRRTPGAVERRRGGVGRSADRAARARGRRPVRPPGIAAALERGRARTAAGGGDADVGGGRARPRGTDGGTRACPPLPGANARSRSACRRA